MLGRLILNRRRERSAEDFEAEGGGVRGIGQTGTGGGEDAVVKHQSVDGRSVRRNETIGGETGGIGRSAGPSLPIADDPLSDGQGSRIDHRGGEVAPVDAPLEIERPADQLGAEVDPTFGRQRASARYFQRAPPEASSVRRQVDQEGDRPRLDGGVDRAVGGRDDPDAAQLEEFRGRNQEGGAGPVTPDGLRR